MTVPTMQGGHRLGACEQGPIVTTVCTRRVRRMTTATREQP